MTAIALFRSLNLIRSMMSDTELSFGRRIIELFREEYLRIYSQQRIAYLNNVLDSYGESDAEIARLLGYNSRSSPSSMRQGKISEDVFELIKATLGNKVHFDSPACRKHLALVETTRRTQFELLARSVGTLFNSEVAHWMEQALCEDRELLVLRSEEELDDWLSLVSRRVRAVYPSASALDATSLRVLVEDWGPAFLRTRTALFPLMGVGK